MSESAPQQSQISSAAVPGLGRAFDHVLIIMFENMYRDYVPGNPYMRRLARQGIQLGNFFGVMLEIKWFIVPGWDGTSGPGRQYPGHTRVNHAKYIVTDRRINIGTSNMTWDYFASTAGSSFNADHPALVATLQAVFNRDWASSYAWRPI